MKVVFNMRRTLREHGLSNKRLSDLLGISPPSVSQMISANNPTMAKLIEVATVAGFDVRDFFYAVDDADNELDHIVDPYLHQSVPSASFINSSSDESMKSSSDEGMKSSNDEKPSSDGDAGALPVGKTMKTDVLICPHCGTKFMVFE